MDSPTYKPQDAKYHAYGLFDVTQDPPTLVEVRKTRAELKEIKIWREDADNLRIRRAQFKPYES